MTVVSLAQGLGGLVAGYKFDEASGTSIADFSGNSLTATLSTNGTLGGAAVLPGSPRAVTGNGTGGAGSIATRAVTGGSLLQLSELTVCAFVRPSAVAFTASHGYLGRRDANWVSRFDTSRRHVVVLTLSTGVQAAVTSITGLASGVRSLVWFSYDEEWTEIGYNDVREQRIPQPGAFTQNTNSLSIGSIGGLAFDGQMEHYMIFDRKLELGELRGLVLEGDPLMDRPSQTTEAEFFDNAADDIPAVAASARTRLCEFCGGLIRENEEWIEDSNDKTFHRGCWSTTLRPGPLPTALTSSSVQADYAASAERLAREILDNAARRPSSTKNSYFNGQDWVNQEYDAGGGLTGVGEVYNLQGLGVLAATVGRYVGAGRRDPLIRMAVATVESVFLRDTISAATHNSVFWGNGDFTYSGLGRMLVLLDGIADPAWHAEYVSRFLTRFDDYSVGGVIDSFGVYHPGGNAPGLWYINGNREIDDVMAAWAAWRLDPTTERWEEYDDSVTWTAAPTAGSWQPGGSGSGLLFGWVETDVPTEADGSDGKGYFRENHGASPQPLNGRPNYGTLRGFWNVGATSDGDSLAETVNVDGLCFNYTHTQCQNGGHVWLFSGEDRWAYYMNMCRNQERERVNTTTGVVTPSYSARHTNPFNWTLSLDLTLPWKGKRAANDLDEAETATIWRTTEAWMRQGYRGSTNYFHRTVGRDLAQLFMGLDNWPGH